MITINNLIYGYLKVKYPKISESTLKLFDPTSQTFFVKIKNYINRNESEVNDEFSKNLITLLLLPVLILEESPLINQSINNEKMSILFNALKGIASYTKNVTSKLNNEADMLANYIKTIKLENKSAAQIIQTNLITNSQFEEQGEKNNNEEEMQKLQLPKPTNITTSTNPSFRLVTVIFENLTVKSQERNKILDNFDESTTDINEFLNLCNAFLSFNLADAGIDSVIRLYSMFCSALYVNDADETNYVKSTLVTICKFFLIRKNDFLNPDNFEKLQSIVNEEHGVTFLLSIKYAIDTIQEETIEVKDWHLTFVKFLINLIRNKKFQRIRITEFIKSVDGPVIPLFSHFLFVMYKSEQADLGNFPEVYINRLLTKSNSVTDINVNILESVLLHFSKNFSQSLSKDQIDSLSKTIWFCLIEAKLQNISASIYYSTLNHKLGINLPSIEQEISIIDGCNEALIMNNVNLLLQHFDVLKESGHKTVTNFLMAILNKITTLDNFCALETQLKRDQLENLQAILDEKYLNLFAAQTNSAFPKEYETFKLRLGGFLLSPMQAGEVEKKLILSIHANSSTKNYMELFAQEFFKIDTVSEYGSNPKSVNLPNLDNNILAILLDVLPEIDKDRAFEKLLLDVSKLNETINLIKARRELGIKFLITYYKKYHSSYAEQCDAIYKEIIALDDWHKIVNQVYEDDVLGLQEFYEKSQANGMDEYANLLANMVDKQLFSTAKAIINIICEKNVLQKIRDEVILKIFEKDAYETSYIDKILEDRTEDLTILDSFESIISVWLQQDELPHIHTAKIASYINKHLISNGREKVIAFIKQLDDAQSIRMLNIIVNEVKDPNLDIEYLMELYKRGSLVNKKEQLFAIYAQTKTSEDLIKVLQNMAQSDDQAIHAFRNQFIREIIKKKPSEDEYIWLCKQTKLDETTCGKLLRFVQSCYSDTRLKMYKGYLENAANKFPQEQETMLNQFYLEYTSIFPKAIAALDQIVTKKLTQSLTKIPSTDNYRYMIKIITSSNNQNVLLNQIEQANQSTDFYIQPIVSLIGYADIKQIETFIQEMPKILLHAIQASLTEDKLKLKYFQAMIRIEELGLPNFPKWDHDQCMDKLITGLINQKSVSDGDLSEILQFYIQKQWQCTFMQDISNYQTVLRSAVIKEEVNKMFKSKWLRWLPGSIKTFIVKCKLKFSPSIIQAYQQRINRAPTAEIIKNIVDNRSIVFPATATQVQKITQNVELQRKKNQNIVEEKIRSECSSDNSSNHR